MLHGNQEGYFVVLVKSGQADLVSTFEDGVNLRGILLQEGHNEALEDQLSTL